MATTVLRQMKKIHAAIEALKALGWKDARYAPRGVELEVIEVGSVGTHTAVRDELRLFWIHDGESFPSYPILYRLPNGNRTTVPKVSTTAETQKGPAETEPVTPSQGATYE